MLLIATDEAGYGPKLGPLVIVATTWRLPDSMGQSPSQEELDDLFACVREPTSCGDDRVVINDSKAVYQSRGKDGLRGLHAVVSAADDWVGLDGAAIVERVMDGVAACFPEASGASVVRARAVKEERATVPATPAFERAPITPSRGAVHISGFFAGAKPSRNQASARPVRSPNMASASPMARVSRTRLFAK